MPTNEYSGQYIREYPLMIGKPANCSIGKAYTQMMRRETSLNDKKCHVKTSKVWSPTNIKNRLAQF